MQEAKKEKKKIPIKKVYTLEELIFPREYAKEFLKLLNPVAPHITEELWNTALGNKGSIAYEKWPVYDEAKTIDDEIEVPVQINGKVKTTVKVALDENEDVVKQIVHENETIKNAVKDKNIVKEIYVKNKIYNIVVK